MVLEDARQDTYNFEVADTHTYFVGQLNAWVHNACDPGDLLANGGQYLGDDKTTMVGVHGSLFEKLPDGTFENIRPATAEEIELAGVVVQPLDASVGTNSFAVKRPGRTVDDLIGDLDPLPNTGGRTTQYSKSGGFDQANADFDALGLNNVRTISRNDGTTIRVGQMNDGTNVVVRPNSSDRIDGHVSQPTLEVQYSDGPVKVRY